MRVYPCRHLGPNVIRYQVISLIPGSFIFMCKSWKRTQDSWLVFYWNRSFASLQIGGEIGRRRRRRINCFPLSALLRAGSFAFSGLGMARRSRLSEREGLVLRRSEGKKNDPLIWNLKSVWRLKQSEGEQKTAKAPSDG